MTQLDGLMEEFRNRFESALKENTDQMALAQKQYETAMNEAQQSFASVMENSKQQVETDTQEALAKGDVPAAAMIDAPDGEQLMVLNKEAVILFLAIFERIADVAKLIEESGKKG